MDVTGVPAGTVAVGVDDSDGSRRALAYAVEQAAAEHRPLTLVHAVGVTQALDFEPDRYPSGAAAEGLRTQAQRVLDDVRRDVTDRDPSMVLHEVLRLADPRDVLLAVARHASLMVVGSRGRGPVRTLLLGSVSVAVTRHAACPVVVVRPGHPGLVRQGVLVGADGSPHSPGVLDFAFRQASLRHLPVTVLLAFDDATATTSTVHGAGQRAEDFEDQRLLLSECVSGLREKYPDVSVRTELARGPAAQCLISMGDRMNLVVVGSHHGGVASEILFGSVASSVVEHASCPVAVVPASGSPVPAGQPWT
jgi:nucleotide-binding universal stress UspA family protein